jgi:hypothetical protein
MVHSFYLLTRAHVGFTLVYAQVTWDDQQAINSFGKLNNRLHELRAELNAKKVRQRIV